MWNVKLVKVWLRPALMHVLQLRNYCAKVGRLDSYWNMCCNYFVRVCGEGYFKQLLNGSGVCGLKSWLQSVAVNLRASTLGLHPGRNWWIVAHYVVSASQVLWSPPGSCWRRVGDVLWPAVKSRGEHSESIGSKMSSNFGKSQLHQHYLLEKK